MGFLRRGGRTSELVASAPPALVPTAPPFCRAPSTSMYLDPRGEVKACCQNEWGRLGNITEHSLEALWRGPVATRLRAAMVRSDLSLGCEQCARSVEVTGPGDAYARVFDQLRLPAGGEVGWPAQLELALSNACNLQCVMCNGELSSSIRIHREGRASLPEVYGDDFFEELDLFLPHVRSLVFLGGEPFLGKEPLRVMARLVDLGLRPHCAITTNGTQWSPRIEQILRSFPTHVTISIDGSSAETVEATRVGAVQAQVLDNVGNFRRVLAETGSSMSIASCLMRTNWHELGAILAWADDLDVDVFVNTVVHPASLSLSQAPVEELGAVVDQLRAEDRHRSTDLRRNRDVWARELHGLEELLRQRRAEAPVEVPVAIGAPAPERHPGTALVRADSRRLVTLVEPGDERRLGLELSTLVGGSIWELVRLVSETLGTTVSSVLEAHGGGTEERRVVFDRDGATITMIAHLVMAPDGGQDWYFRFQPDGGWDSGYASGP